MLPIAVFSFIWIFQVTAKNILKDLTFYVLLNAAIP